MFDLDGKKTYIVAAMLIVVGVLQRFDFISEESFVLAVTVLLGSGFYTLRDALKKK